MYKRQVLCRAELSNWDFAVLGTGILRNALAVVGAVDIHLATAIGAIEQAREGSCFAPVSYTHLCGAVLQLADKKQTADCRRNVDRP